LTEEILNMNAPWYLLPYVLIGSVAVVAAVGFGLDRALRLTALAPQDRRHALWSGLAVLVVWFFAAMILSRMGFYQGVSSRIPTVPFGLLIPIAAGVILFLRWPMLRRIIEAVPQGWITSIQIYRVEGLIFLLLYSGGWLPGAFAWPAGVGDVLVGLLAPVVGIAYMRRSRGSAGLLLAWNLFGIADLVVAVTTGFLTSPSPVQLLALDRPNELITSFPLAMVPVFVVPLSMLLHLASLEKLRQAETGPLVNRAGDTGSIAHPHPSSR
jgi:hypothetical protein